MSRGHRRGDSVSDEGGMNPTVPPNLIDPNALWYALESNPATPYSRPVRVSVRGKRERWYIHMAGGVGVPGALEHFEDLDKLMREVPKVEVTR